MGLEKNNFYTSAQPKLINDLEPILSISAGGQSMAAIAAADHSLYVWGNNFHGQLGISIQDEEINFQETQGLEQSHTGASHHQP